MAALAQQLELDYTTLSRAPGAIRARYRNRRKHAVKAVTIPARTTVAARVELALAVEPDADLPRRPRTRGDCIDGPRPCPWASCAHHLHLDVSESGGIKINKPDVALEDMDPMWSCALDVSDRGEHALEEIAAAMNLTREGVRVISERATSKLRRVHLRVLRNLR